jgi:hypothetical protein
MKKPNLNLMSMEQLDRLTRNEGEDRLLREGALRELCKRENTKSQDRYWRSLTPRDYAVFDLL